MVSRLSYRVLLLSSAACILLRAGAHAEMPAGLHAGAWVSVEGRYAWVFGSRQPWAALGNDTSSSTALTDVFEARVREAWGGSLSLGYQIDPVWDVAVAYTGLRGHKRSASASAYHNVISVLGPYKSYWDSAQVQIRNDLQTGDFEVGYNVGLGMAHARFFGGVRIAQFRQKTHVELTYPDYFATDDKKSRFFGAGPRIGVAGEWPLAALGSGRLKLIGSLGGAILIGESRQHWHSFSENSSGVQADLGEERANTRVGYNLEASLGGAYEVMLGGNPVTIAAGYRFDGWWNINDTRTALADVTTSSLAATQPGRLGTSRGDVFFHGPFVRVTVRF